MSRRTKIVATIGPACEHPDAMERMLRAGVDVCRLNLSHGTIDEHLARLATSASSASASGARRRARRPARAEAARRAVPRRRRRPARRQPRRVRARATGQSTEHRVTVDYPTLLDDVDRGDRVVLGDGTITLDVASKTSAEVFAEVRLRQRACRVAPACTCRASAVALSAPTAEDLVLADTIAAAGVDYIALSLPRRAADVDELRAVVGDRARILAKIETAAAIRELAEIAAAADAVMVARGDLGIDCPLEDVPHLQKQIIRHCVEIGTPVVTATQMLESMIHAPPPTRAEVSDVANAVFDGTDAVMLSGETAIGDDPAVVRPPCRASPNGPRPRRRYRQWAAAPRAGAADPSVRPASSASPSRSPTPPGRPPTTSRRPPSCAAPAPGARRGRWPATDRRPGWWRCRRTRARLSALTLSWGVETLAMDESDSTDDMVWFAVERAVAAGVVRSGDTVVVIAGAPDRSSGAAADVVRIVRVQ